MPTTCQVHHFLSLSLSVAESKLRVKSALCGASNWDRLVQVRLLRRLAEALTESEYYKSHSFTSLLNRADAQTIQCVAWIAAVWYRLSENARRNYDQNQMIITFTSDCVSSP